MNIAHPFYDERKSLLIVTHAPEQENHLRDPVLFLADIVGLYVHYVDIGGAYQL